MATILSNRALNRQAIRGGKLPAEQGITDTTTTTTVPTTTTQRGGQRSGAPSAAEYGGARTNRQNLSSQVVVNNTLSDEEIAEIVANAFKGSGNQPTILQVGGGGAGSASLARLAWDKQQAATAADTAKAQKKYYEDLIKTGKYKDPYTSMRTLLASQRTTAEDAAKKPYTEALTRLKTAYESSKGTLFGTAATGTTPATPGAYNALATYIAENPLTAYRNLQVTGPSPIENALAAYQRAQGVSSAPTDAAVEAMRVAASGGAGAFQNLVSNLQAAERLQQSQRALGAEQAKTYAQQALERQYLTGQTGLTNAQAAALASIGSQYDTALSNIQTQEAQRLIELNDLIAKLGGYK